MWHGYVGIEDLGLTTNQRNTLVAALRSLGPASDPQPAKINHWRTRLDDKAVIFEALFNDQDWTIETIKARLAGIFGISAAQINHTQVSSAYGPVITFQYPGATNKLRLIPFASISAAWPQSRQAADQYIKDNLLAWQIPTIP